jgi:hypothetical protein
VIISHKHRFIFTKNQKVAGSAIEMALSVHCGPDDIVTPLSPHNEALRQKEEEQRRQLGGVAPQNYRRSFTQYSAYDWRRFALDGERQDFRNHLSATRIRQMVGEQVWDSYYKFCIERDPFDKAISAYDWVAQRRREQGLPEISLHDFIFSDRLENFCDWHRYAEGGDIIVDRVLRYENLASELAEVCEHLGLPTLSLPTAKAGHRTDRRPASDVLGWEGMERVAEVFGHELEVA